ncbi:MAG: hypothetical protein QOI95_3934, partial [Acidimicrobiaceae bacterium]
EDREAHSERCVGLIAGAPNEVRCADGQSHRAKPRNHSAEAIHPESVALQPGNAGSALAMLPRGRHVQGVRPPSRIGPVPRIVDPLPAARAERDAEIARIEEELGLCSNRRARRHLRRDRRNVRRQYRRQKRARLLNRW